MLKAKPFVKWAGGKGSLISSLEELLPEDFDEQQNVTYIEPFVGGGAMFFHMLQTHNNITRAVINDINSDLIHCYELIRDNPQILIGRLEDIVGNINECSENAYKELYYAYRIQFNETDCADERAALFIYLNHTCYNGLFRVNGEGKFNVPYGSYRYKNQMIFDKNVILKDHEIINNIEVVIRKPGNYNLVIRNLSRTGRNFIYFDPPYRPTSATSSFRGYSNSPFNDIQQEELKRFCDSLTQRGCQFMLSNSDSRTETGDSYFENLYRDYNFMTILAPRCINSIPQKRKSLKEVLIRNY